MKPWAHQTQAIAITRPYLGLTFDPGTGKTYTGLMIREKVGAPKMIAFAPISVCRNWRNEVLKYVPRGTNVYIVAGQPKAKKLKIIKEFISDPSKCVLAINNESARNSEILSLLAGSGVKFVIVDEFHQFKNPEAKQTLGLEALIKALKPDNFLALTGTPSPNGPIDLWSLLYFLGETKDKFYFWRSKNFVDTGLAAEAKKYLERLFEYLQRKNKTSITNYYQWKKELVKIAKSEGFGAFKPIHDFLVENEMMDTPYVLFQEKVRLYLYAQPKYTLTTEGEKEVYGALQRCTISAKKDEVLDLPPLLLTDTFCALSDQQADLYYQMQKTLFAADEEGNVATAKVIMTRTLRLLQIASGIFPTQNGEILLEGIPREETLKYCIETIGNNQFLIWTHFAPHYKILSKVLKELGISHEFITGEQKPEARHLTNEKFQAGDLQAVIGHPRAGGIGTNYTKAGYSIYYSKNFNLTDYEQAGARNNRGGSELFHKRLTQFDIMAEDTVDEKVTHDLRQKKSVQDFITGLRSLAI